MWYIYYISSHLKQTGGNEAIQIVTSDDDYYLLNAETITEEAPDLLTASMHTLMTFLTVMISMMKMTTITIQMMMMYKLFSSVYMTEVMYNCQLYSVYSRVTQHNLLTSSLY